MSSVEDDGLEIAHHHPGRLRLRSPSFRGGAAAAERARDAILAACPGARVEHDIMTGSILIHYEPGRASPEGLAEGAAQAAGLRCTRCELAPPERAHGERILGAVRRLNDHCHELSGYRVELRTAVPIAVAGMSVVSLVFGKGPVLPRWDNLAYWSLSLFALLHGRELHASAQAPRAGAPKP